MSTHEQDGYDTGDGVDVVAQWIREHPETWADGSAPLPADVVDAVVADIVSGARMARIQASKRTQRKVAAGGVLGALLVAGGAVGVAALVRSGQPSQPSAGAACREGIDASAVVIVIEPSDDPVGGCEAEWAAGRLSTPLAPEGNVPPLIACISDVGVVEVYPGDEQTCRALGFAPADAHLDEQSGAIVALQERISDEINLAPCVGAHDVAVAVQRLVDESGLAGWMVETAEDSVGALCAKAAVDATTRIVQIVKFP